MNKFYFNLALLMISPIFCLCQTDFYYYKGEKITFNTSYKNVKIWCNENFDTNILYSLTNNEIQILDNNDSFNKWGEKIIELKFLKEMTKHDYNEFVTKIYLNENIHYATTGLIDEKSNNLKFFSNVFHVFIGIHELEKIKWLQEEFNIQLTSDIPFLDNWYSFRTNKNSKINCSSICKVLNEKGTFKYVEPDLFNNYNLDCVNDQFFFNQWHLSNTGQNSGTVGVDLKVCDAWSLTMGNPNIITAVIDEGIDLNHPDLISNIYSLSYDANNDSSPSVLRGSHGTACAGIISAQSDNTIGVSGVAPNSKLMSISRAFVQDVGVSNLEASKSINFATNNGASIISNSYSGGSPSQMVDDAISNSLQNGRNGLGCVVVFSSGNSNSSTSAYPSNSNPQIINVGAVDRCGIRSGRNNIITNSCDPWPADASPASSYGTTLDIVAGGTGVLTTDIQGIDGYNVTDYTGFGGTSAACPQVAGVAALILSVNPCLTQQAVHDIICASGQKLSNYSFATQTGTSRENLGSWNNEVGHGLVNANACVNLAKKLYLQNRTINSNSNYNFNDIEMGSNVTNFLDFGQLIVNNNATSTITAMNSIIIKKGTSIARGSNIIMKIDPNLPCNYSNPFESNLLNETLKSERSNDLSNISIDLPKINLFPNPTNEILNINSNVHFFEKLKIEIYTIGGQIVYSDYIDFGKHLNTSVNLTESNSSFPGIYFVKLYNSSFSNSYKIIKL